MILHSPRNYFIWKGIDSRNYNVTLIDPLPTTQRAQRRVEEITIPGMNGSLYIDAGTYEQKKFSLNVLIKDNVYLPKIKEWLQGAGDLILGTQPNYKYKAIIYESIDFKETLRPYNNVFTVAVEAEPFLFPVNDLMLNVTVSPSNLYNTGDVITYPFLKVYGNGTVSISINTNNLTITNVSNYINIDCETGAVYKDNTSYEKYTTGTFPIVLNRGANTITFNNKVTNIEIKHNLKFL